MEIIILFYFIFPSYISHVALTLFLYISARSLLINIQNPFPTISAVSSLTQAFLNDLSHFKYLFCPSYTLSLPWCSYSYIATLFPHQSPSTCVIFLSLPQTHLRNIHAFLVHHSLHTIAFLLSFNGYRVKEGGSCIYGPVLFTINSHSSPGRTDKLNSCYSHLSISISVSRSGYCSNGRFYKIDQQT